MNKGILIGILIFAMVGIVFAIAQVIDNDSQQIEMIQESEGGPKQYTVGLS